MLEHRPPTVACARRAVEAWCDGRDAMQPLQELPGPERELARAIARNQCQMIQWYGQNVLAGGYLGRVPEKWRPMVERYVYTRRNRQS